MLKVKKSLILKEAKEIRSFMEKNKKIPKSCQLGDGTILSPYSVSYLMASMIQDKFKKDIYDLTDVVKYDSSKFNDNINGEEVKTSDYLFMINNFINFCKKYKRVPSYITTQKSGTEVSFELFMYCLSKIIVWYQNNKTLPNYCTFNKNVFKNTETVTVTKKSNKTISTSTSAKTSSSNKTVVKNTVKKITRYVQTNLLENIGCSGRGQCTSYYCSCNALQQMFYRLTGILVPEKTIAKWAGVTTAGVGHAGIETAVAKFNKTYGKNLKISWKNFSDLGSTQKERFENLGKMIIKSNVAVFFHLCYKLLYGHYEPIKSINTNTQMLEILNSLGTKNSDGSYQGYVENRGFATQQSYISAMNQKSLCIITV